MFAECCVFNKQLQPAGIFDRFNLQGLALTIYAGAPSPEVTVLFCLVPSPEFSQAPEYSLPDHLCRFRVRFVYNYRLEAFPGSRVFATSLYMYSLLSDLNNSLADLPTKPTYIFSPGQPTPG